MKVIAINGSPKPKGNTYLSLKTVCDELETQNIETEIIHIGHKDLKGCIGCNRCKDGQCVYNDDSMKEIVNKILAADGLLLGSPVYYSAIAGTMKCFLDRLFYASHSKMRLKVGAGIVVCRRSGGVETFDQLSHYFLISEMMMAPSYYWNVIHGGAPGEISQDEEGMSILKNLGNNMGWMLKMREYSNAALPAPDAVQRSWANFVR